MDRGESVSMMCVVDRDSGGDALGVAGENSLKASGADIK